MGEELKKDTEQSQSPKKTVVIRMPEKETNPMGIAGFVLSIVAIFLACIPFLGWVLWLLGLIFSIIGVFKKPKSLAIAGVVISLMGFVILILLVVGVIGMYGLSSLAG